jgi:ABC-type microcin C transport system duplicated ATPase subunit YejF
VPAISSPLLEIKDLDISFAGAKGGVTVVNKAAFSIPSGSIFGLAGESGSGKSLTALSIMGILPNGARAQGSIKFRGREILGLPPEEMRSIRGREISMVFQEPMTSLNPVLKIGYQVKEALLAHLPISKKEAQDRAEKILLEKRAELDRLADELVKEESLDRAQIEKIIGPSKKRTAPGPRPV